MPRISLCMIARDEEAFLGACLASAAGAVDEIVVVDTGSRDTTVAIAERAGARVLHLAWRDDFSAARNAALDAATGTHVLVLDADERLAPSSAAALRRAAADAAILVGLLPLSDATTLDASIEDVVSGRSRLWNPVWVPRFFVRDPRLRFERRVHETLFRDAARFAAIARESGAGIAAVDAPIVHYGEVRTLRADRDKRARNVRLLEMSLAEDPRDGDLAGFLAMELYRAGDMARARAIGEQHLDAFLQDIVALPSDAPKPSPVQLASVLATCLLQDGAPEKALDVARRALAACIEPHPNLRFLEGAALERIGAFGEAERAWRECIAMHSQRFTIPANPGATHEAPRLRLANLCVQRGDARTALELLEPIDARDGSFATSVQLLRAEAHLVARDPMRALQGVAPLLASKNAPPDLFAIAGRAAELLGQPDAALAATANAAPRERWLEPRRRAWFEPR
jgi:tetratricopeptide (TPR) repeat protein